MGGGSWMICRDPCKLPFRMLASADHLTCVGKYESYSIASVFARYSLSIPYSFIRF